MINPLIVCALKDEFNIETERYSLLHSGVGKVNAAISLTEHMNYKWVYNIIDVNFHNYSEPELHLTITK